MTPTDAPPAAPDHSQNLGPPAAGPEVPPQQQEATHSVRAETATPIRLIGLNDEGRGREWTFPTAFLVGKVAEAGLNLSDGSISRKHAHLWHQGGEWWVADLASSNGTYVNGTRIGLAPVGPLRSHDTVQFGRVALQVRPAPRPARAWAELSLPSPWSAAATIRIRSPHRAGPLTAYPLFHAAPTEADYALPDEAIAGGWLSVSEVSAEGRVSELVAENRGHRRVLFLEGEELRGGKQNRVLNATVMVPAGGTIRVPVSCVEQGRWGSNTQPHMGTGSVSSTQLRHALRTSVTRSLHDGRGHSSDQQSVWDEVRTQHHTLGVVSATGSMTDTVTRCADRVANIRQSIPYTEGSAGVLVAVGGRLVSLDLFDSPNTCRRVWDRLVTGSALDGLMAGAEAGEPSLDQITHLFAEAGAATWAPVAAVGDGTESRAEFDGMAGSALVVDGALVHGSLVGGRGVA